MISVIIPTYKNLDLLLANLRHNLPYLKGTEIIIVNDDPKKSIRQVLKSFPVTVIENAGNLGFGGAVNRAVQSAKGNFVMLLNSDVLLNDDSYTKGLIHFINDQSLFAVSFGQQEKNSDIVGKNKIFWRRGLVIHQKATDMKFGQSAWAEGGTCLIDKDKFLSLGSFDTLYKPFYWEDIDLSYRARKAGYSILFDPSIQAVHHHESTIGKYYHRGEIERISYRNQFIFTWKNITDTSLIFSHFVLLLPNMVYYIASGEINFLKGFFMAIGKLSKIFLQRGAQKKLNRLKDSEILTE